MTSYQDQPLSRRAIREREAAGSADHGSADDTVDAPAGEEIAPEPRDDATRWAPAEAPVADASADPVSPVTEGITMTRRQLRALREAQEREATGGTGAPVFDAPADASSAPSWAPPVESAPPVSWAPPVAPEPSTPADAADPVAEQPAPVAWEPAAWEPAMPDPATWGPVRPVESAEETADVPPPVEEPSETPAWLRAFEPPEQSEAASAQDDPSTDPVPEASTSAAASFEALLAGEPAGADPWSSGSTPPVPPAEQAAPPAAGPETFAWQPPTGLVFIPPQLGGAQPAAPEEPTPAVVDAEPEAAAPESAPVEIPAVPVLEEPTVEESAVEEVVAEPVLAEPAESVEQLVPAAPEFAAPEDVEAPELESTDPELSERPRNHWSRQAELDDEVQPATESLIREVGVGSATANALVLPETPNPDMLVSSFQPSGDGYVTGSIVLPPSLSATGALPAQLDESDLDHVLDPGDQQVASTDSMPVRAIRAVSSHTSSREIIGTVKPKRGNRALTALIIAAAGMAVVVVTLLVVALVSGVLG